MNMKRIFFIMITLIATLTISAQTIRVYEYDGNNNLNSTPSFTSSNKVKVVFTEGTDPEVEHEYVDLGLPSGTLWATCNIGAESPSEKGLFFAWGDIEGHPEGYDFSWNNYKFYGGISFNPNSMYKMTKYWFQNADGGGDYNTILDYSDDAAYMIWGHGWEMPTVLQLEELMRCCYWEFTANYNGTGVSGCIVYKAKSDEDRGKSNINNNLNNTYVLSDKHIFFSTGAYWSRNLHLGAKPEDYHANPLSVLNNKVIVPSAFRCEGLMIRPVRFK